MGDQNWSEQIDNSNRLRPEEYGFKLRRNLRNYRSQQGKTEEAANKFRGLRAGTVIKSITHSGENSCHGDALHICSAKANYGGIEVDWENQEVYLSIFTPFETVPEAARVTL